MRPCGSSLPLLKGGRSPTPGHCRGALSFAGRHSRVQPIGGGGLLRIPLLLRSFTHFHILLLRPMSDTTAPLNVLFLCTHNSARSILAEALLNDMGHGRFKAYSAGSSPRANQRPHPLGLQVLQQAGVAVDGLRSKSWDEFAAPGAPPMDLVITVCDNAAGEICPIWPGHPATAHWSYPDPSEGDAPEEAKREAFRQTMHSIRQRLALLVNLPADKLEKARLQSAARALSSH